MSHGKHRAPRRRHLPRVATATAGPLALAALGVVSAPAASAMAPAAVPASVPVSTPTSVPTAEDGGDTYTVRSGDTLAKIASAHSVAGGWKAIADANSDVISSPSMIMPGQELTLPGGSSSGSSGSTTTQAASDSSDSSSDSSDSSGSSSGSSIVDYARGFSGTPYVWGGTSRSGVDCSGLTTLVLQHFGHEPPRTAAAQHSWAESISESEAQAGDLVFGYFSGGSAGHVGIYLGDGKMIDAPSPGQSVGVHSVSSDAQYGRVPA